MAALLTKSKIPGLAWDSVEDEWIQLGGGDLLTLAPIYLRRPVEINAHGLHPFPMVT